jgi:hypothetical protein
VTVLGKELGNGDLTLPGAISAAETVSFGSAGWLSAAATLDFSMGLDISSHSLMKTR